MGFVESFVPRISLVIFVEVFAYFLGITDLSAQSADEVGLADDILHIGVRGN